MKLYIATIILGVFTTVVSAQHDVTKFLGIPVDGYKSQIIKKLEDKGYKYDAYTDMLTGEFNGYDVNISIVTNNNKVYRIFIQDANYTSETSIRIRFNKLVDQFNNNKRYLPLSDDNQYLTDNEDISYQIRKALGVIA